MAKQDSSVGRAWYAIHTYAGYENAVARNLKQRIESLGLTDKIFNVVVPTERTVKIKGGRRVEEEEKVYPGYVLVDMLVDDQSWFVVRNTPRVTGFVGSGVNPVPLAQSEVDTLLGRMQEKEGSVKHAIDVTVGDSVVIVHLRSLMAKWARWMKAAASLKCLFRCSAAKRQSSSISCRLSEFNVLSQLPLWQRK